MNDPILAFFAGLCLGAGMLWLYFRQRLRAATQSVEARMAVEIARLEERLLAEQRLASEKSRQLVQAEDQLIHQFKVLAADILEEKSRRFAEQNQTQLGQLLDPLRLKLAEFQQTVHAVAAREGKDRAALAEQVKSLLTLNQQLSNDAHNLTNALKGQSKTRGNWGELILQRVLEAAGLRPGHEFDTQVSSSDTDGARFQPDVVVHLPEDRHIVIDAKLSLLAYETHANAENEETRRAAAQKHLESVRAHIRDLSGKNYHQLYGLPSLDFVLMFIPVEPAFLLAISTDENLWQQAWSKNILLVSPSTLLFVLRSIAHLWRQEQQNQNAQAIAQRGALLYDKLAGFIEDLSKVGERLDQAKDSFDKAQAKLRSGQGNVLRQAELLREMGIKPNKVLPKPEHEEPT